MMFKTMTMAKDTPASFVGDIHQCVAAVSPSAKSSFGVSE
jgi:hypothetical protein